MFAEIVQSMKGMTWVAINNYTINNYTNLFK